MIIHEAFQFLIVNKKGQSGRSCSENWIISGGKVGFLLEILKKEEPGDQSGVAIKGESPDKEGGH